jgi:hypothetical protein
MLLLMPKVRGGRTSCPRWPMRWIGSMIMTRLVNCWYTTVHWKPGKRLYGLWAESSSERGGCGETTKKSCMMPSKKWDQMPMICPPDEVQKLIQLLPGFIMSGNQIVGLIAMCKFFVFDCDLGEDSWTCQVGAMVKLFHHSWVNIGKEGMIDFGWYQVTMFFVKPFDLFAGRNGHRHG